MQLWSFILSHLSDYLGERNFLGKKIVDFAVLVENAQLNSFINLQKGQTAKMTSLKILRIKKLRIINFDIAKK